MKKHHREDLIRYRIGRARETLEEVDVLIKLAFWNTAVNRLYYACFYALSALLLKENIKVQTHGGVRQMLGLHFIQTNRLSRDLGRFYSDLYDKRQMSDYDDFVRFDEAVLLNLKKSAEEFVHAVELLIDE